MKNVQIKTAEDALETLRLATEAANLGIWDLNLQTGELHWSELSKKMFGVLQEGPLSLQDFWDRIHPSELERVRAVVQEALNPRGTGEYDIEYRICRPDGEQRIFHATGKAFFEGVDGSRRATHFIGTLLDRTEQKLAQEALLQAEQLATTGRLTASISHEINNPLEAVSNLLYLLRDEIPGTLGQDYLKQAESELARVSEIASNTLRFYKDPKGSTSVQVADLTQSVLKLFQGRLAVRCIEAQYRCEPNVQIKGFQGELRQVLINLVGNAIDAMPTGGTLKVRCRAFRSKVGHREAGVGIYIADTGTGMSPETLRRAFDPFFTTKGSAGTGLGLWLSREILNKHGFKLRVRSMLGRGTVFSISMPDRST